LLARLQLSVAPPVWGLVLAFAAPVALSLAFVLVLLDRLAGSGGHAST
jgi:hypothetical protein